MSSMQLEGAFTSRGWRRRGIAALSGACGAAALPPFYLLPLLVPAFSGLFLLVRYAPGKRQAFLDGWWWGLGHFTAGLYWICISMWVDPQAFAWATPFALFGLPAVLAVYVGLVTLALYCSGARGEGQGAKTSSTLDPRYSILLFALLWTAAEYLRAHLFTGFPWNLIGYVWTASDATLQFASVAGIYGLSWITALTASMPALFLVKGKRREAKRLNYTAALMLACMTVFGLVRLATHPTRYTDVKVRIVQANVEQSLKWEPTMALKGLRKYVRLTRSAGLDGVKLVLWPETAVPYYIGSLTPIAKDLGSILPPGALLITGGLRGDAEDAGKSWNSVFAINGNGKVVAGYDKHHLVPFGEYIPLRDVYPVGRIAEALAPGMGDFARGPGPATIAVDPYPSFSPLVCYEAIFPGEATDGTGGARWLLSLTDDAWFGFSTGPYQDIQMARVRAVEQGLPLLRAANTGVSGAFDAYGRTLSTLSLEKEGVIDLYLPLRTEDQTIYGRYPQVCVLVIFAASIVFYVFSSIRPRAVL